MLTKQEENFLLYWEKNRERERKLMRQLFVGLPIGLLISAGILLSLDLDWYKRANMVANSSLNPFILVIAVAAIAVFTAIFYKKYQWEMNEQRYQELIFKKKNENNPLPKTDAAN